MTAQNKLSLILTILFIAIGLGIAAISRANSPTDQRSYYLCGTLHECAIG